MLFGAEQDENSQIFFFLLCFLFSSLHLLFNLIAAVEVSHRYISLWFCHPGLSQRHMKFLKVEGIGRVINEKNLTYQL